MHRLQIDGHEPQQSLIDEAVDALLDGGVIAYPTDTLFGLGCDATNARAVERLREIKGRPASEPLPIIVHHRRVLEQLTEIPPEADALLRRFWPGALTLVLRRRGTALSAVSPAGTLGVRIPDAPIALALARGLCRPIIATSANRTGASPLGADEIARDFAGDIALLIESNLPPGGVASTVLDLSGDRPKILREGALARSALTRYLPELT